MHDVIRKIAKELNEQGVLWGIGASVLLQAYEIVKETHDIDIIVAKEDIDCAVQVFDLLGKKSNIAIKKEYVTEHFFVYEIDGVSIDVMAAFKIKHAQGIYEFKFDKTSITKELDYEGVRVPLSSLEDWLIAYQLMVGREEKVNLIKNYFMKNGLSNPKILSRALEQDLLDSTRILISEVLDFNMFITTDRLVIIPMTYSMVCSVIKRDYSGLEKYGINLNGKWPLQDTLDILCFVKDNMDKKDKITGFDVWMVVKKEDMTIIGDAGFKGVPDENGEIEMGFGLVEEEHRKGYGYEVANALIKWASQNNSVKTITAECLIDNIGSKSILKKCGMQEIKRDSGSIYWQKIITHVSASEAKLVELSLNDGNDILVLLQSFDEAENGFYNPGFGITQDTFRDFLLKKIKESKGIDLEPIYVPQTLYWLFIDDKPVGIGKLRDYLNDSLKEHGGHIGYGITANARGNGFGTIMLQKLLLVANSKGIHRVLLTCNPSNVNI